MKQSYSFLDAQLVTKNKLYPPISSPFAEALAPELGGACPDCSETKRRGGASRARDRRGILTGAERNVRI